MSFQQITFSSIEDIRETDWDAFNSENNPFISHHFLKLLEKSGSVSAETGWTIHHQGWTDTNNDLVALMPLYIKRHSYGEYMFDWDWAHSLQQSGIQYYPKMVSSIPFTPVNGPRLMFSAELTDSDKKVIIKQLLSYVSNYKVTAQLNLNNQVLNSKVQENSQPRISNLQTLFIQKDDTTSWKDSGALIRTGYQFTWYNKNYKNFDDFLSRLRSKSRKNIRRERRVFNQNKIEIKSFEGEDINSKIWDFFILCYQQTYLKRSGHQGYLNATFFHSLKKGLGNKLILICAFENGHPIASSLFIKGENHLYGRYWGAIKDVDGLHFECCYYQAIEYCINNNIECLQPGTQGQYKRRRGFIPEKTYGAYYFPLPQLQGAIKNYLNTESTYIDEQFKEWDKSSPYKE